jgi:MoaA/NifB/PqqE/SkfB family radical SAM enzyme
MNFLSIENLNYYYSRILQEMAFRTGGSFGKATSVIVLFTNRCNARCVHCYSWKLPSDSQEITTQEWERVFDELRTWLGPVFVAITGGETLLRKDSVQLAKYASKLGFWVKFLTNGYLMNPEVAEQLIQSGVKRVEISLDGSHPEIHDKVRGRDGFFPRVTEALKTLVEEKNLQKRGTLRREDASVQDLRTLSRMFRVRKKIKDWRNIIRPYLLPQLGERR